MWQPTICEELVEDGPIAAISLYNYYLARTNITYNAFLSRPPLEQMENIKGQELGPGSQNQSPIYTPISMRIRQFSIIALHYKLRIYMPFIIALFYCILKFTFTYETWMTIIVKMMRRIMILCRCSRPFEDARTPTTAEKPYSVYS